MTVTVKARLIGGKLEKEYSLPEGVTTEELTGRFLAEHRDPAPRANLLVLLNGKQCAKDSLLRDGDVLELIMLLCGG